MKKAIKTLLMFSCLGALTLGFAACGEEPHTHTPVKTAAVSATCTTDGNNEYYACSGCNKVYTDEACTDETTVDAQTIAASHTYSNDCDATCNVAGCNGTRETAASHTDDDTDGVCESCAEAIDHIYDETTNTYTVYTADGLYAWAESAKFGDINTGLILAKDIVMPTEMHFDLDGDGTNESNWEPLVFNGTIDGNGHSIAGVTVVEFYNRCAFLSDLGEDGIVKNLSLKDVSLEGNAIGGVVVWNNGVIANCNVDGTMQSEDGVGGIAMANFGTIAACHNAAELWGVNVGGIAGQMNGESVMVACYNTGTVVSTYKGYGPAAGGIVGSLFSGSVIACYNTATVSATSDTADVGGIVGYTHGGSETLLANYWNTTGETPTKGNGRNETDENALKVDGETIAWEAALTAMNAALESAGNEWRYALNTGEDAATRPLILTKASA